MAKRYSNHGGGGGTGGFRHISMTGKPGGAKGSAKVANQSTAGGRRSSSCPPGGSYSDPTSGHKANIGTRDRVKVSGKRIT